MVLSEKGVHLESDVAIVFGFSLVVAWNASATDSSDGPPLSLFANLALAEQLARVATTATL